MNETQQYFATEIALDHADGIIPRREALRGLLLLGLTVASASTLLAACEGNKTEGSGAPTDAGGEPSVSTPPPSVTGLPDAAVPTESITFPGVDGRTLQGAWATSVRPLGAVLVMHENRGLTEHIANVAGRFAAAGYAALALDLLSEEGGTGSFADAGEVTGALGQIMPSRFVEDMRSALDELVRRVPGKKLVYAELDTNVNGSRETATSLLEAAGLKHEIVTFLGANHAFFNDTGARHDPEAASAAWAKVLAWFGENLA